MVLKNVAKWIILSNITHRRGPAAYYLKHSFVHEFVTKIKILCVVYTSDAQLSIISWYANTSTGKTAQHQYVLLPKSNHPTACAERPCARCFQFGWKGGKDKKYCRGCQATWWENKCQKKSGKGLWLGSVEQRMKPRWQTTQSTQPDPTDKGWTTLARHRLEHIGIQ